MNPSSVFARFGILPFRKLDRVPQVPFPPFARLVRLYASSPCRVDASPENIEKGLDRLQLEAAVPCRQVATASGLPSLVFFHLQRASIAPAAPVRMTL